MFKALQTTLHYNPVSGGGKECLRKTRNGKKKTKNGKKRNGSSREKIKLFTFSFICHCYAFSRYFNIIFQVHIYY